MPLTMTMPTITTITKARAAPHRHTWRPFVFKTKKVRNPDPSGLLVHCRGCDALELVAPRSVGLFFQLLKCGIEPRLVTPKNRLVRRSGVSRHPHARGGKPS